MSLDGYIGKSWKDIFKKHFISFDDDGYYWELYPTFEKVNSVTGQLIDLYGGANFNSQTQIFLKQCLEEKLKQVISNNDTWEVIIGWQIENESKTKFLKNISKDKLIHLIEDFIFNIDKAKRKNRNIIFLGD